MSCKFDRESKALANSAAWRNRGKIVATVAGGDLIAILLRR
jgi:hypothetical protein